MCITDTDSMEKKMDEEQKREYQTAALAALLHDVCKLLCILYHSGHGEKS